MPILDLFRMHHKSNTKKKHKINFEIKSARMAIAGKERYMCSSTGLFVSLFSFSFYFIFMYLSRVLS